MGWVGGGEITKIVSIFKIITDLVSISKIMARKLFRLRDLLCGKLLLGGTRKAVEMVIS
jgi:hypothetical protein